MTCKGLFNCFIDKAHGGLGFSTEAQSEIKVTRLQAGVCSYQDDFMKKQFTQGVRYNDIDFLGCKLVDESGPGVQRIFRNINCRPLFENDFNHDLAIGPEFTSIKEKEIKLVSPLYNPHVREEPCLKIRQVFSSVKRLMGKGAAGAFNALRKIRQDFASEENQRILIRSLGPGKWVLLQNSPMGDELVREKTIQSIRGRPDILIC